MLQLLISKIRIKCKSGTDLKVIENLLYSTTSLQSSLSISFISIDDTNNYSINKFGLIIIEEFINFRFETVRRVAEFDLEVLNKRKFVLDTMTKAVKHIDRIIKIIKNNDQILIYKEFGFNVEEANIILDIKLSALSKINVDKVNEELKEIAKNIKKLNKILSDDEEVYVIIENEQKDFIEAVQKKKIDKRLSHPKVIEKKIERELIIDDEYYVLFRF